MDEIQLKLDGHGQGAFAMEKESERLAEMVVQIRDGNLTVLHTEVNEILKGQGIGSKLLMAMVSYAREHKLKVISLCSYVSAQFKRHPEQYADVWNKSEHP